MSAIRCSHHGQCGADVYWIERGGRFSRPMDLLEIDIPAEVLVVDEVYGRLIEHPGLYRLHQCDPEQINRHNEDKAEQQRYREEYDRLWRAAVAAAKGVACPKCGVAANDRCLNLRKGAKEQYTKWPHKERLPEGWDAGLRPVPNEPPEESVVE